jgi:hypothetical protein
MASAGIDNGNADVLTDQNGLLTLPREDKHG